MKKLYLTLLTILLFCFASNAQWVQIGDNIDGEEAADFSSTCSLSNDGSTVAISAPSNDGNGNSAGHVRVFENNNGAWTQVGDDIDGEAEGDQSGQGLSLSGDGIRVAIGARGNNGINGAFSGHTRVFENISGVWTQVGDDMDGEASGDQSGKAVSLNDDGSIVAIGAEINESASGQVRVYQDSSGT